MSSGSRILLYSHDTYGLGHLRRSLSIAERLANDISDIHQLLVTGSMVAGAFATPPRLDIVKLPALSKRSSGRYKARALPLTLKQTLSWRADMILQAVIHFRPDILLVDKTPAGVHGELLPTLRQIKTWSPHTRLVLGMRDIEDSPEATRAEWLANDTHRLLDEVYDLILLYGRRDVFDPVDAYGMSSRAASKLVECGFLRRAQPERDAQQVRRELGLNREDALAVVTVGGGGDGYPILSAYLELVARANPVTHSLLVTGPLMSHAQRQSLARMAQGLPVTLLTFTPDLVSYLAAADLVISMAGYNSTCEILSLEKRALLIPRAKVREEQRIRARALARRGLVHMLDPRDLSPPRLQQAVIAALNAPRPRAPFPFDGLKRVSETIAALCGAPAEQGALFLPLPYRLALTIG
ncbi:MAG: glycosyltransferase [Chloroflexi bacterium]|nr:glycosyltransferase [Chloroflexota bacterium]